MVQRQQPGISRHHVQRAAGMATRMAFKSVRRQIAAIQIHPGGVGHVHHQPHGLLRQTIQILQTLKKITCIRDQAFLQQRFRH